MYPTDDPMLVPKIPSRSYPRCSSHVKQARASFTACRFACSVNPIFAPTNWSARSCPFAIRRSWYGKLIFNAEIPIRCSQWHNAACPCHFAFQIGKTSTAGPIFFPEKNCACTVLFSAQADSTVLVNVSTFSASSRQSRTSSAAYHASLFAVASRAYSRTYARASASPRSAFSRCWLSANGCRPPPPSSLATRHSPLATSVRCSNPHSNGRTIRLSSVVHRRCSYRRIQCSYQLIAIVLYYQVYGSRGGRKRDGLNTAWSSQ